jgi:transposase/Zn finger protein HypA/HybF involved in hydrogenase expression
MNKSFLERRIDAGVSLRKIAVEAGVSLSTVRYWVRKFDIKIERHSRDLWNEQELRAAVQGASSKREVLRRLGRRDTGSIYTQLGIMAEKWGIELPVHVWKGKTYKPAVMGNVFRYGSGYNGKALKRYMISFYNVKLKCALCPVADTWQGKPLTLHVDHIDGDHKNNIIQNLRLLCPNCHSQTETYSRKGRASIYPPATNVSKG